MTITLHNVNVTSDELALLQKLRQVGPHKMTYEEVVQKVGEALREPPIALLLERWENGVLILRLEFENKHIKYVKASAENAWKAGRDF